MLDRCALRCDFLGRFSFRSRPFGSDALLHLLPDRRSLSGNALLCLFLGFRSRRGDPLLELALLLRSERGRLRCLRGRRLGRRLGRWHTRHCSHCGVRGEQRRRCEALHHRIEIGQIGRERKRGVRRGDALRGHETLNLLARFGIASELRIRHGEVDDRGLEFRQ